MGLIIDQMRSRTIVGWCIALFLILFAVTVSAEEPLEAAVKRLSAVGTFAFGGVGYAGATSKGEIDFKLVLSQREPAALAAFEKIYATGNPQGKSYALSGIRKLKPLRFRELLASGAGSRDEVNVMRGCIVSHELLPEVAQQIDHGKFRF
jgi:hypothetical protein